MAHREIEYEADGTAMRSVLVQNTNGAADRPLMLIAPNWIGVSPEAISRAERLVGDRYIGLVVDMYGGGRTAKGPNEAGDLASAMRTDTKTRRLRMQAALDALRAAAGDAGATRSVVAVGFCFGGGNVLELARTGANLKAAVSVHGDLTTLAPANKGDIRARILVLHGSEDPIEPQKNRLAIETELQASGASWEMGVFGGLLHSFSEEEANVKGIAEYSSWGAHRSYAIIDQFFQSVLSAK